MKGAKHSWWWLWANALGAKVGEDTDADKIAIIRTVMAVFHIVIGIFIAANCIHQW